MGISGVLLLISGLVYAAYGIKNKWIYVSGSAAYLTTLAVTVLIVYLMSPPVSNAIQGAFFVAAFLTGVIFGVLSLVFSDITEGFGCLLGGFCLSMWFLCLKDGGLIGSSTGRAIFIGCMSAGGYSLSFSRHTRTYGLIASIAFSGATAAILGIDCLAGAGLKEFWLYLWNLNDGIFPLNTNTYPVTKNMKAELAGIVIIAVFSVVSQMRVWKMVKERRAKSAAQQLERQQDQDREEEALGRKIEDNFQKERAQWEAAYGGKNLPESSIRTSITSPKGSTSIREREVSATDSVEMVNMSKGGVQRSMRADTPASTTITVGVMQDDDIRHIDNHGNLAPKAPAEPTQQLERNVSLRPSAPPPPPAVVPLPFTVPKEDEDARTDDGDNASVSVIPESNHGMNEALRPLSKRISDMSALRPRFSRDVSESREALISESHIEDDRASSLAATLDDDHDAISLRQLSPPHSPIDTEHETTLGDSAWAVGSPIAPFTQLSLANNGPDMPQARSKGSAVKESSTIAKGSATTDVPATLVRQSLTSNTNPKLTDLATKRASKRDSRLRVDTLVDSTAGSSEDQRSKPTQSVAPSQASPHTEHAESRVGSLRDGVLSERLSKVALSYRTNEWAKHLEAADRPDIEDLQEPISPSMVLEQVPEERPAAVSEEIAAPLPVSKRDSSRTSAGSRVQRNSSFGLQHAKSTFSQESLDEQQALSRSPSVLSPTHSSTRVNILSPLPSNTLMGQRDNLMKTRVSSQSLTPHGSAANLLADQTEQENMTLAQRRQVLQQQTTSPALQHQTSVNSQRKAPPSTSQKWQKKGWAGKGAPAGFDSHQPRRTTNSQSDQKREQLYAGWRDNMKEVTPPQTSTQAVEQQRAALLNERKQREMEKQQRESVQQQRASMMDSMMRSGQMLDAHREAMRKMQANANKHS
ncbi:hypothetical protein ACN47E_005237 [Coniothyrium glycines]